MGRRKPLGQAIFLVATGISRLARARVGCYVEWVLGCPERRRPRDRDRISCGPRLLVVAGRRAQPLRPSLLGLFGICCVWVASFGCGRKATVDDCQRIVKRITELELKDVVSEQQIGSEISDAQQTFRERALSDCVGRRITEKALACVDTATNAAAIIDDCFD